MTTKIFKLSQPNYKVKGIDINTELCHQMAACFTTAFFNFNSTNNQNNDYNLLTIKARWIDSKQRFILSIKNYVYFPRFQKGQNFIK